MTLMDLFQHTFLERKHSARNQQYLNKFHWIEIELNSCITQYPKPVKGFIISLVPPSPHMMTSYYARQLVVAAKKTNVTKSELLNLVEKTFDGKVN